MQEEMQFLEEVLRMLLGAAYLALRGGHRQ